MWYADKTLYSATYNVEQEFYCYPKLGWILHFLVLVALYHKSIQSMIFGNLENVYINHRCKFICLSTTSRVK